MMEDSYDDEEEHDTMLLLSDVGGEEEKKSVLVKENSRESGHGRRWGYYIKSSSSSTASRSCFPFSLFVAIVAACLVSYHVGTLNPAMTTATTSQPTETDELLQHISQESAFLANVSYSQLRQAIIELYHAHDPETTDESEQFYEANRAMKKVEKDGLPIPISDVDGLYVGSIGAAYNLPGLDKEGITHIVSLERGAPCHFPWRHECLHIDYIWDDGDPDNNITQTLDASLPFIHDALEKDGRVLVHCWNGESRSVSTIIAYMIKYFNIGPKTALEKIQKTRPTAKPNRHYWDELRTFREENKQHNHHNNNRQRHP